MKFLSICSGIEAASVAWNPLGWESVGFSEIEPFPCAVLKHHFPIVKNYGDMTRYESWNIAPGTVDLVSGGTPCQSFSIAGKRGGLDDARGNLMLVYLKILDAVRPRWVVWENVPGVLSSNGGRDFGTFLGGLGKCGYGFAYRVLDARYFGVPQRRRRVFVVGYFGDWRPAAAVLFERHSLQGHHPPSRKAWEIAPCIPASGAGAGRTGNERTEAEFPVTSIQGNMIGRDTGGPCGVGASQDGLMYTLTKADVHGVAHSLRGEGHDASEDGTGRGTPLAVSRGFQWQSGFSDVGSDEISGTIVKNQTPAVSIRTANTGSNGHGIANGVSHTLDGANGQCVALEPMIFQTRISRNGSGQPDEVCPALTSCDGGLHADSKPHLATGSTVRRLTPRECERLQGFPDYWTRIPWRGKAAEECPDGPRYKAIGNSWAVPCARWIGGRIEMVEKIL